MFPKLRNAIRSNVDTLPLFFQHPETGEWFGAFAIEIDWLTEPELVFVPISWLHEKLVSGTLPTFAACLTVGISLPEYIRMVTNA